MEKLERQLKNLFKLSIQTIIDTIIIHCCDLPKDGVFMLQYMMNQYNVQSLAGLKSMELSVTFYSGQL